MALTAVEHGLPAPSAHHPGVSGVVVDIPAGGGFASLVAMTDGTTSMYTSTGGGTIGAGAHEPVAGATRRLLSVLQDHLPLFAEHDDGSFPPPGSVRFHLLSPHGRRRADAPESAFWGDEPHRLDAVIASTQSVVTAIRELPPPGR